MRILWINHRDPKHPEAGGSEVHLEEIGKRLAKGGHEITLLAEHFKKSPKKDSLSGINIRRFGGRILLHAYAMYFVRSNSAHFDVIIDDVAHAVPFWSNKFTEKPVVALLHHVHQDVVNKELPLILRRFVKRSERTVAAYENVLSVSETTKRDMINQLGVAASKIRVIHNGIDHEKYVPGEKFPKPSILWMGRMKKYKNVDRIIEAFGVVKRTVPDAQLILVGKGEQETRIKSLAQDSNQNGIIFEGRVPEDEKIRLLQGAWCLVSASEIEGWGMTVMEAAACKTPAVAYNCGALCESVIDGETGILVEFGNTAKLAEALIKVLGEDDVRRNLSENAFNYSLNFDWNKSAFEMEEYLKSLAS